MAVHQTPPSLGFSRQEHWSGLPFPSPVHESEKWKEVAQLCLTLSNPMDYSLPGSSVQGFSRQEYWSGVPLPSLFWSLLVSFATVPLTKASHMTRFRGHVRRHYQRAWIEGHGQIGFITANNLQECLPPQELPILPTAWITFPLVWNGTAQTLIPYMLDLPLSSSQHLQGSLDCVSVCAWKGSGVGGSTYFPF